MPDKEPQNPTCQFGVFELNLQTGELLKRGIRLRLQQQPLRILGILIEHAGEIVTREEIQKKLWPEDNYLDFDNAINSSVRKLRDALGENAGSPRFIETLSRRGYRFIAPISTRSLSPAAEALPVSFKDEDPLQESHGKVTGKMGIRGHLWLIAALAGVIGMIAGVAIWVHLFRSRDQRTDTAMRMIPATTYPGRETTPALSPDGSQLAFAWEGESGSNFDIYVKIVGENRALRLTSDPRPEFNPAWSPDGRHIAFCRNGQGGMEIVVIPALGGAEHVVATFPQQPDVKRPGQPKIWVEETQQQIAWFPDGQFLAIVALKQQDGVNAIFRLNVDDGAIQPLTSPLDESWGDGNPSISPDGHWLAFTRSKTNMAEPANLYVLSLSDQKGGAVGKPQEVMSREINYAGLAWTSDGSRLVFAAERGLWTATLHNSVPKLLRLPSYNPSYPAVSAKGNRMAFVDSAGDLDIWRVDGPAVQNRPTGRQSTPMRMISSTRDDTNPQYSPDGRRIAFTSSRGGTDDIWVSESDGSNPVQVTNFNAETATPRWSPNGRYLAFDSMKSGSGDIYVIPSQGGQVRRITPESSQEDMASWSRDGKWIYFHSDRNRTAEIWKAPASGGTAVQVTSGGGADAFESRDGKFVYYAKWTQHGIWRKPVAGGPETLVTSIGSNYFWGLFDNGICAIDLDRTGAPSIRCLEFDSNRVTTLCKLPKGIHLNRCGPSFSISPDGRWILYVTMERQASDVMAVENFR